MNRINLAFWGMVFMAFLGLCSGCSPKLDSFPFGRGIGTQLTPVSASLQVRYHSVGCFYLEANGVGVLTDPFWTHASAGKVLFGKLTSDPKQIEPHLPRLKNVKAITVAHGHYDHVMDLPYIDERLSQGVKVLGSQNLAYQMEPCMLQNPIIPMDSLMATEKNTGQWIYTSDSSLRILPIRASHGPHVLGFKFYDQSFDRNCELPPTRATDFQEGQTLSYLYDFMNPTDKSKIAYRVFFMSSSTGFPDGYFPVEILEEKEVDVALLTVDCTEVDMNGGKGVISFLKPQTIIINHWENFFRKKSSPPKSLRVNLWDLHDHYQQKKDMNIIVPMWDRVYEFPERESSNP